MALLTAGPPSTPGARGVLAAVRAALEGAGPAVHLGGTSPVPVPAGVAAVVTTSGSTGYPKDVLLSRSALIASASSTAARIGEGAWLLAVPATYVAGLQVLVRSLLAGHEPAILEGHFSVEGFVAAARGMASAAHGTRTPTYTSLVPAQMNQLIAAADAPEVRTALASFEAILVGGQALADTVRERAVSLGARIVRTYGASETSGGCVYDGVPLDGVRVRVADGEVQLSGPMLAEGYRDDPARTAAVFVHDDAGRRWYRTGDAGSFEDGRLRITGRLDNVIVSGGINVSLDRVERVVRSLPGFEDAVVVGAAHERWGESPVVVVPEADAATAARLDKVRAAVGADLGAPARPDRIEVVASIPLLSSGKPDRRALRALVER